MIVVDATVLADRLIGTPERVESARILQERDPEWISVSLWCYELGNVLWKHSRWAGTPPEEAREKLRASESLLVETFHPEDPDTILDLAQARGLSFYDASYAWLARSQGLKLHTRDAEILRQCPDLALPMP
jgi:predicted nucleic acid-binding protein